jgi:hypothetical protein
MVMEQQSGAKIIKRSRYEIVSLEIAGEENVQVANSVGKGLQKGF